MNALTVIHDAFAAGVDLNVRGGKLYIASGGASIPAELLVAIRDLRADIIHAQSVWPRIATLRTVTLDRCQPLTPADLAEAERDEAESLAAVLAGSGGLGQYVICLTARWNDLSDRDRLAAAWCWEFAVAMPGVSIAA